jgi:hypothetical protein
VGAVVVAGAGVWLQETMLIINATATRRLRMTENLFIELTSFIFAIKTFRYYQNGTDR